MEGLKVKEVPEGRGIARFPLPGKVREPWDFLRVSFGLLFRPSTTASRAGPRSERKQAERRDQSPKGTSGRRPQLRVDSTVVETASIQVVLFATT